MACPLLLLLLPPLLLVPGACRLLRAGCSAAVSGGLPQPEPLLLQPGGPLNVSGYLRPGPDGVLQLAPGQRVLLACPGSELQPLRRPEAEAACEAPDRFRLPDGRSLPLAALACARSPYHSAERSGARCGAGGRGSLLRLGHATARGFVTVVLSCFDEQRKEAVYADATVLPEAAAAETGVARPSFAAAGLFGGLDPDRLYGRAGQTAAVAALLGSRELAEQFVSNSSDVFLARGHLAAKAYFALAPAQRATFFYANAAPQWQTLNAGNWERLEGSVRRLAAARGRPLRVLAGGWGRARLPGADGRPVELALGPGGQLPVPALFWKVVLDPATGEGAAFLALNNPHSSLAAEPQLRLCPDVCGALGWLGWQPDSGRKGEAYCCEVAAARAALADLPALPPVGGLLV